MQVKKYEALTMEEALQMVKTDLGADAVILSSKTVSKGNGRFGLFERPLVEVTAANNYEAAVREKKKVESAGGNLVNEVIDDSFDDISDTGMNKNLRSNVRTDAGRLTDADFNNSGLVGSLKSELEGLRSEMVSMSRSYRVGQSDEIERFRGDIIELKSVVKKMVADKKDAHPIPQGLESLQNRLFAAGVNEYVIGRLIDFMQKNISNKYINNDDYLKSYLHNLILKQVKVTGEMSMQDTNKRATIFIGATGVGKTTTIAKIAADYALNRKMKVGLVTLDTYRIAAVEQLKIYANILKIPVYIAASEMEFASVMEKTKSFDIVLVDTAGRNYNSDEQVKELKKYFGAVDGLNTQLVLSANSKDQDLKKMTDRFSGFPVNGIIFTKLDETSSYGSMLNIMIHSKKSASYLTFGQNVPEDIELATAKKIAGIIMDENKSLRLVK